MTENETEMEVSGESKFTPIILTIMSVLLIFVGPTYIPYLVADIAHAGNVVADVIGFVLFIAGIGLLVYVLRKKIVT
jgi:uncharacterized membrane protein HdeD (DUF308 family)